MILNVDRFLIHIKKGLKLETAVSNTVNKSQLKTYTTKQRRPRYISHCYKDEINFTPRCMFYTNGRVNLRFAPECGQRSNL